VGSRTSIYLSELAEEFFRDHKGSLSGRINTVIDRYSEILRRNRPKEFSGAEMAFLRERLRGVNLIPASSIKRLWLRIEGGIESRDISTPEGINAEDLISKMKELSFIQEVALLEMLNI
jgi:hypothetical protein